MLVQLRKTDNKMSGIVSFICTTYRRYTCVNRIIAQYHAQTYPHKELIIFNTDMEYPMTKGFVDDSIIVVNNNIDYVTGLPYTTRGQICRDAVTHATGEYFMLADDDDLYLPWHMEQAVDKIREVNQDAWKPQRSFFMAPEKVELVSNTMEASVIVRMERIRDIGFGMGLTGYEGLSWYVTLRNSGQLNEHYTHYVPSYCFNWSDPDHIAGHKQSGDINNPDNFENHKRASRDYTRGPLVIGSELGHHRLYDFLFHNMDRFPPEMMEKYVGKPNTKT